jgi:hypothetical protein
LRQPSLQTRQASRATPDREIPNLTIHNRVRIACYDTPDAGDIPIHDRCRPEVDITEDCDHVTMHVTINKIITENRHGVPAHGSTGHARVAEN